MRNKKWMTATLAGCLTMVFGASVGFALNYGGYSTSTSYPGGTGTGPGPIQPPSPMGNCSAALRQYSAASDPATGYPWIVNWTVVQGNSLAACQAAVSSYLSRTNEHWELSPGNPWGCACSEAGLAIVVDRGGYDVVRWDSAKDAVLNVRLQELRQEYRVDEYFKRVNEVVNQEVDAATAQ